MSDSVGNCDNIIMIEMSRALPSGLSELFSFPFIPDIGPGLSEERVNMTSIAY